MSSENHHVDEFLNSLIDGELTVAEEAELRRLLDRDKKLARRLEQLRACRTLVNSLPKAKVPPDLADRVRQTLERRSLLGEATQIGNERVFASHLVLRRVAAVAAALILVGALSVLVYSILAPSEASRQPLAVNQIRPNQANPVQRGSSQGAGMAGRLVLRVASLTDMEMFVTRACEDSGVTASVEKDGTAGRRIYRLQCNHAGLEGLLSELAGAWSRFEDPTFYLETGQVQGPVRVASVSPEQLVQIASQGDGLRSAEVAREIAVHNTARQALAGEKVLARMTGPDQNAWLDVAKPVLTGSERPAKDKVQRPSGPTPIHLTVVLESRQK